MNTPVPTIKGIFVKQHIKAVNDAMGDLGLAQLAKLYKKPLSFKNNANVPIADELELMECAVLILNPKYYTQSELEYESGRFHLRNFVKSPLARIFLSTYKRDVSRLFLHAIGISNQVIKNTSFSVSKADKKNAVIVTISSTSYPPEHMHGFFDEWFKYQQTTGTFSILPDDSADTLSIYHYLVEWQS